MNSNKNKWNSNKNKRNSKKKKKKGFSSQCLMQPKSQHLAVIGR